MELEELYVRKIVITFDNCVGQRLERRGVIPRGSSVFLIRRKTMIFAQTSVETLLVLYEGEPVYVRATDFGMEEQRSPRLRLVWAA
ncbi:MAG: hypothetical protein P4M11_05175 [Candidatus Pacebacteria bacterium]|nr:hypothetical protein [Candidatus Paceibacterota bacterium]